MRRIAYPFGRYMLAGRKVSEEGPRVREFIRAFGYPIVKFDEKNEGDGTLVIAVNKTVAEIKMDGAKWDPIERLTRLFHLNVPPMQDLKPDEQRVGIEFYLWPVDEGVVLEVFVLPYMEHMDRTEVYRLTQSWTEEIADWYLAEQIWAEFSGDIEKFLDAEPMQVRS